MVYDIASTDDETANDLLRQASNLLRKPTWDKIFPN
jgi:hypothetical protein